MTDKRSYLLGFYVVAFSLLFAITYLAWQASHGGVVSHHLLDQRSLPAVSNWWGLVILPLIGGFASWSVQRRVAASANELPKAAAATVGALLVGIALSISFAIDGNGSSSAYIFLAALVAGLFLPTYRAEYVFGFVVGMSLVFGLVIPAIAALVAVAISAAFHFLVRPAFAWAVRRARDQTV